VIIGIDVDLTVVDTLEPWIRWFYYKTGSHFPEELIKGDGDGLDDIMRKYMPKDMDPFLYWEQADLYADLKPIPVASEFIERVIDDGHSVVFVTLSAHGHYGSKERFLRKFFPRNSGIVHTADKHLVCMDMFIDDNIKMVQKVNSLSKYPVKTFLHKTKLNVNCEELAPMTWEEIYKEYQSMEKN
jgi:5'(3')-deoxyribonucleotidase